MQSTMQIMPTPNMESTFQLPGFQKKSSKKAAIFLFSLAGFDFLCWIYILIITNAESLTDSIIFIVSLMTMCSTAYLTLKASKNPIKNNVVPLMILSIICTILTFILFLLSLFILNPHYDNFSFKHVMFYANVITRFASVIVTLYLLGISCGAVCCLSMNRYQPAVIYTQTQLTQNQLPPQYLQAGAHPSGYISSVTNAPIYVPQQSTSDNADPLPSKFYP